MTKASVETKTKWKIRPIRAKRKMIVDVVYFVFYEMRIVVASIEAVKSPNKPDVYERKTATAVVRCRVVLFINITLIEVLIAASACVCTYYV